MQFAVGRAVAGRDRRAGPAAGRLAATVVEPVAAVVGRPAEELRRRSGRCSSRASSVKHTDWPATV